MTGTTDRPTPTDSQGAATGVAGALARLILRPGQPIALRAYDGSAAGSDDPVTTVIVRRPEALRRMLGAPGELGIGRAFVAGDLDVEGDLLGGLRLFADQPPQPNPAALADLARAIGPAAVRPLAPPPEEAHLHGRRHSKARDAAAISHHYNVSNEFYRLVLGPSMTYSCALWESPTVGLERAQDAKHELICRKLALAPGDRLLDVGCGWGSLALHAAGRHGARVLGVTISERQAGLAQQRVKEAGLDDRVEIRLQDYRDVTDGPFDAISSVGMFEHVGRGHLVEYFGHLHELLRPGARLLNHGITRSSDPLDTLPFRVPRAPWRKRTFTSRFVFPDGELLELGHVISAVHQSGLEVRHIETLREHYALTLRAWVANLEGAWDEAVALVGEGRARVWQLYMAGSAVSFERGRLHVHQVLAVRADSGRSGMALRPAY